MGDPQNKDESILGSVLGSPILGNYHLRSSGLVWVMQLGAQGVRSTAQGSCLGQLAEVKPEF